ncbi:cobaltochelatase subunit CobN [Methanolobus bombayensis]|uniref:cobaltochelatase subunit CobN n=1 Tax=Methanolobus bombayensis TaxID=38023 RepID=UPI001FD822BC|nr:cobaltochelatase subunit CobN [Methanolobus bombayensis]MBP1910363.1 cobaltochelatase CobN [Methanolobus bombayensis]
MLLTTTVLADSIDDEQKIAIENSMVEESVQSASVNSNPIIIDDPIAEDSRPKICYVLSRPYAVTLMQNVAEDPEISSQMNISIYLGTSYADLSFDLSDQDLVVLRNLDAYVVDSITPTVNEAKANGAEIVSIGETLQAYDFHTINTSESEYSDIGLYQEYASEDNFKGLTTFLGVKLFNLNYTITEPMERPVYGIYHPLGPHIYDNLSDYLDWYSSEGTYDPEEPTIAIITTSYKRVERDMPLLDPLVEEIEGKGYNAIVTTYAYKDDRSLSYLMLDTKSIADAAIVISRGSRLHYKDNAQGIADLETLNITMLDGARLFSGVSVEEWEDSIKGVPPAQQYQVAYAELDGIIEPIVISGKAIDEATGIEYNQPIDYQVEWLVDRTISWAELHEKDNSEKKVVIPYYNPEGGKADVGADIDYYLDAQASLANLLEAMKERGYNVGNDPLPNSSELADMMVERGHNVGNWAPGELNSMVENGTVILIPESQYMGWFDELPQEKQHEMTDMWGEAPGNIMVYENETGKYLVIPVLEFGNILLSPDPQHGWSSSEQAMYNNGSYPPTHQCFAFYKYMSREYDADALFTIFSSVELMPGKECGLSAKDWGALLLEDMPHIHVLPMDAEGVFDRRRANMLIIDFMTPTIVPSGLYGDLANLQDEITLFKQATDSAVLESYRESILNQTRTLYLDNDLGADLYSIEGNATMTDEFIDELSDYLYEIKTAYMPYGSHILGEVPDGESLVMLIKSMLGDDYVEHVEALGGNEDLSFLLLNETILNGSSPYDAQILVLGQNSTELDADLELAQDYLDRIQDSECEITKILDALDGTYITPGPSGDPIRNPDALPTGRNLYTFDDRLIPTKAAWDVGSELAEEMLDLKLEEDGKYPEKIAFLLWSVETTRNQGVMESEIFKLLGVEPQYDSKNRVSDLRLMNSSELGRSRIDVMVVTSGLYRDVYPSKIELIDEAIKLAASADDDTYPNYVRIHSNETYQSLIEEGYNESLAYNLSVAKIFCPPLGGYTPGIQEAITSDTWEDPDEIASLYIDRMGYVYGEGIWGEHYSDVLEMNLADVDTAVFSRTSNLYGVLDHNMVAAYFGGLSMAVKSASGSAPAMYINDLSSTAEIETLSEFLNKDLRSRYLNPNWIEGMMGNGFDGTRYMDSVYEVMRVWDVTAPSLVTDEMMDDLYKTYFEDQYDIGVDEYLESTNPYAYQSMAATALDSIRTDYWDASDDVRNNLVKEYVESTVENGVTCCHHTCGNPLLNKFIQSVMESEDLVDDATAAEYKRIMQAAILTEISSSEETDVSTSSSSGSHSSSSKNTELTIREAVSGSTNQTTVSDSGAGMDMASSAQDTVKSTPDNYVEGYEMTPETVPEVESGSGFSMTGSELMASLLVLAGVGAIYLGFWRRK